MLSYILIKFSDHESRSYFISLILAQGIHAFKKYNILKVNIISI